MAIPGLSSQDAISLDSEPSIPQKVQVREQRLAGESEYRFESSLTSPVSIRLLSGIAELFGTELAPTVPYFFRGVKGAIYTWQGCELEITGTPEADYVADETPMMQAANLHFALQDLRMEAVRRGSLGPRVMVIGPENAGKTSLVKILTAYALKSDQQATVINLDPKQGLLSMPGSLTATTMATLMDIEQGWGSSPVSGPTCVPVKMPLSYHFAFQEPEQNVKLFRSLVARIALSLSNRFELSDEARTSGVIVDTPGSLASGRAEAYELIQFIASELMIDTLLVLGSERLLSEMKRRLQSSINVIKLDKSGGCVDRSEGYMKYLRQQQIRDYFYGHPGMTLSPSTQFVGYDELTIIRIIKGEYDPGAIQDDDEEEYQPSMISNSLHQRITPSLMLQNTILAVTHADANDHQDRIRDASIMCYVYVADVDEAKRRLKLVSPLGGRIPSKALLCGSWPEGVVDLGA